MKKILVLVVLLAAAILGTFIFGNYRLDRIEDAANRYEACITERYGGMTVEAVRNIIGQYPTCN